ncbi:MAG: DNA translocase FtsK [Spirochaetaceae bacterium]|nr:DNA translocase FtsK [Spirochaetaceae bacterium]
MIELAGAAVLGLFSIIMAVSITGALFRGSEIFFGLGNFFVDALGILSFGIPAYLLCAAILLASPVYRPDRIFILSCSLVPFVTLAMGFVFIRDFDYWSQLFHVFYWAGKGGFNLFIILLTVIEGLIIIAFSAVLFPHGSAQGEKPDGEGALSPAQRDDSLPSESLWQKSKPFWQSAKNRAFLLLPDSLKRKAYNPIPEESVFSPPRYESTAEEIDIENIRLPDIKPLASASAMSKLESVSAFKDDPYREEPEFPEEEADIPIETVPSWEAYRIPIKGILDGYPADQDDDSDDQSLKDAALILKETLREFNIQADITGIWKGPVVSMFEIIPEPGVKVSKIINLQDNIALRLAAASIRIIAPIPGRHAVGIEVPNGKRNLVSFADLIKEEAYWRDAKSEIPLILGKEITGEARIVDLVQMPHLLIAGAPGSGKSVCLNSMILSIVYRLSPSACRLIMIDPKLAGLKAYNDIPHLLTPVITEPQRAFQALQYALFEMERRYACLDSLEVRDMRSYNKRIKERGITVEPLPYIVIVIDEFADLMSASGKELESALARLAAMSRTVGIHLILSTQHPSIDVITGQLKANIPGRIAFMVSNKTDSRLIIDMPGAEKLLGKGDMLYAGPEDAPVRMQGAYSSEEEAARVAEYLKTLGYPDYIDDELFIDDENLAEGDQLYERAVEIVIEEGKASAGYLQRRLKVGYNRAAQLIDRMEQQGLIIPVSPNTEENV